MRTFRSGDMESLGFVLDERYELSFLLFLLFRFAYLNIQIKSIFIAGAVK